MTVHITLHGADVQGPPHPVAGAIDAGAAPLVARGHAVTGDAATDLVVNLDPQARLLTVRLDRPGALAPRAIASAIVYEMVAMTALPAGRCFLHNRSTETESVWIVGEVDLARSLLRQIQMRIFPARQRPPLPSVLAPMLKALEEAVEKNLEAMDRWNSDHIIGGNPVYAPGFDGHTWPILRERVAQLLDDVELLVGLADFFAQSERYAGCAQAILETPRPVGEYQNPAPYGRREASNEWILNSHQTAVQAGKRLLKQLQALRDEGPSNGTAAPRRAPGSSVLRPRTPAAVDAQLVDRGQE